MSFLSSIFGNSLKYIVATILSSIILLLVILIIFYFIRPILLTELSPNSGSLSSPIRVGTISDMRNGFFTPSGATIMVSVYLDAVSKTTNLINTGRSILRIGDSIGITLIPGNTQSPRKTVLSVKTQSQTNSYEEILLENFPEQKWVHVTLVREGRRYTVYYNGKIVGSNRTKFFPVINSSQLILGYTGLLGEFSNPKIAPVPLREHEILAEMKSTTNTRRVPNSPYFDFSFLNFGCPDGIFCNSTSSGPSSDPLKIWKTPYA